MKAERTALTAPMRAGTALGAVAAVLVLAACEPRVRLEAPREPIVIHLNVKIEQEIRVRVEREVQDLIRDRKDIF